MTFLDKIKDAIFGGVNARHARERIKARLPHYETVKDIIRTICKTNEYSAALIWGEAGMGKSVLAKQEAERAVGANNVAVIAGFTTPVEFYNLMYDYRNTMIVIIDDTIGILESDKTASIMKDAMWNRKIEYNSTSPQLKGRDKKAVVKSKYIMLTNKIGNQDNPHIKAVLSRMLVYELKFNFKQKMEICQVIIDNDDELTDEERIDMKRIIRKHITPETKEFNLRTVKKLKAYMKYNPDKAEKLFKETI